MAAGGAPWLPDVHAVVPEAGGRWLGVREPRDREGGGKVFVIAADGSVAAVSLPDSEVERPLGWLGPDPVVWRLTQSTSAVSRGRGEVWLAGAQPRLLLADVPRADISDRSAALERGRLLYVEDDGSVWLADPRAGEKSRVAELGRAPVSLRSGD